MKALLKSEHIYLDAELANQFFQAGNPVFISFKEEEKAVLMAPLTNSWFSKLHQAQQTLLKARNQQGDCTTSIRDLILDHDLNATDRELTFTLNNQSKFLKIDLS